MATFSKTRSRFQLHFFCTAVTVFDLVGCSNCSHSTCCSWYSIEKPLPKCVRHCFIALFAKLSHTCRSCCVGLRIYCMCVMQRWGGSERENKCFFGVLFSIDELWCIIIHQHYDTFLFWWNSVSIVGHGVVWTCQYILDFMFEHWSQ